MSGLKTVPDFVLQVCTSVERSRRHRNPEREERETTAAKIHLNWLLLHALDHHEPTRLASITHTEKEVLATVAGADCATLSYPLNLDHPLPIAFQLRTR